MGRLFDMRANHDVNGLVRWTSAGTPDFVGTDSGYDPLDLSSVIVDRVREQPLHAKDFGAKDTFALALAALAGSTGLVTTQVDGTGGGLGAVVNGYDGELSSLELAFPELSSAKIDVASLNGGAAPVWGAGGPAFSSAGGHWWSLGALDGLSLKACIITVHALWATTNPTAAVDDVIAIGLRDRSDDSILAHGWKYSGSIWANVEITGTMGAETLTSAAGSGPSILEDFWIRHHLNRARAAITNHYGGGSPADGDTPNLAYDAGSTTFRTALAGQLDLDLAVFMRVAGPTSQTLRCCSCVAGITVLGGRR